MCNNRLSAALLVFATLTTAAVADVFDLQSPSDNTTSTENELIHKSVQLHDLLARNGNTDVDYYRIVQQPYSSYEVVIDGTAASITPVTLQLVDSDGTTVVYSSVGVSSLGYSRVLRWQYTAGTVKSNQYIRVQSGGCSTTCDTDAVYRIRAYDTAYNISRFYDHEPIGTRIFIENPNDYSADVSVYYWKGNTASATLLFTDTATVGSMDLIEFPANHDELEGHAGFVTVTSTAGYGALQGKSEQFSVDEEVGTPSWDHQMSPRR